MPIYIYTGDPFCPTTINVYNPVCLSIHPSINPSIHYLCHLSLKGCWGVKKFLALIRWTGGLPGQDAIPMQMFTTGINKVNKCDTAATNRDCRNCWGYKSNYIDILKNCFYNRLQPLCSTEAYHLFIYRDGLLQLKKEAASKTFACVEKVYGTVFHITRVTCAALVIMWS